jgi:hypothetical protein
LFIGAIILRIRPRPLKSQTIIPPYCRRGTNLVLQRRRCVTDGFFFAQILTQIISHKKLVFQSDIFNMFARFEMASGVQDGGRKEHSFGIQYICVLVFAKSLYFRHQYESRAYFVKAYFVITLRVMLKNLILIRHFGSNHNF